MDKESSGFKGFAQEQVKGVAFWWLKHNVPVVPVGEDKQPLVTWGQWQTRAQIEEEFEKLPWERATGFAVLCGARTPKGYLGVLDFDVKKQSPEEIELGKKVIAQLPKTRCDATPSGGLHFIYFSKNPVRGTKEYEKLCGLEILGAGNLAIMAPSQGYKIVDHPGYAVVENLNALINLILFKLGLVDIPVKEEDD